MTNRNVTVNSIDKPDFVPNPQYNAIGYSDGRNGTPRRARMPFGAFLVAGLLLFGGIAYVCYRLSNWISDEYAYNTLFASIVQASLYTLIIACTVAGVVCVLSLAFGVFGSMARRGLVELPGAFSVHVLDTVTGWRRDTVRTLADSNMARHYQVQHTLADRSQYRNVTAYSPSMNYSISGKHDAPALGSGASMLPPLTPAVIPPFDDLLAAGLIGADSDGRKQPLIFGYDEATGEPLTGDWKQLYSTGLGGLQGSGKTWTSAFLLAQSALNGASIIIADPHAGDSESLASRVQPLAPSFVCDIADDEKTILEAVKYADDVLKRRKHGDSDRTPLIVAIDEWTALRRGALAEVLPAFVEDFSTEGRKLNCHVMSWAKDGTKHQLGIFATRSHQPMCIGYVVMRRACLRGYAQA